jgi:hypothetical protein
VTTPTTPVTPPARQPSPVAARQPSRGNLNPLLAVLTLLFFVLTVIFGLMALAPNSAPIKTESVRRAAATSTEQEIRDVASRFVENLLTYKYQTIDADLNEALRDATTEFSTRPLESFGGSDINKVKADVRSGQGTSSIDVKASAITSRDSDTATVIVVGTREFDSNKREPTNAIIVMELTMRNTSDGWKVDNAGNPASAS